MSARGDREEPRRDAAAEEAARRERLREAEERAEETLERAEELEQEREQLEQERRADPEGPNTDRG